MQQVDNQYEKNIRLLAIREALGLTQAEMADFLGINRTSLTKIEKCQEGRKVPKDSIYILSKEKGINPIWFETGKGEIFTNKKNDLITPLSQETQVEPPPMVGASGEAIMNTQDPKERLLTSYEKNILLLEQIAKLKDEINLLKLKIYNQNKN